MLPGCLTGAGPDGRLSDVVTAAATSQAGHDLAAQQWAAPREAAVRDLLQAQAGAVVGRDLSAYLRAVADGERTAARVRFERMSRIGLAQLSLVSVSEIAPPVPAGPGTDVTWDVEAAYDYRIADVDRGPRRFVVALTLRATQARPEQVTITASRPADRPQPWDIAGMEVRRSPRSLVVGSASGADLDEVLARADRAATSVTQVWGPVVPAVWVVPTDETEAEQVLGRRAGELNGVAAATDGPLATGAPAGADRIVLSPTAWRDLSPVGRDVVLRHELTHVAVRASTGNPVPLWLSEGFAEYVAYRGVDAADEVVAASLVGALRREGIPEHLPGPERFDPSAGSLSAAYAESWLAVRSLVRAHGEAAVVAFYRTAAGPATPNTTVDEDTALDEALTRLGTTRVELERRWRAELTRLLGP